MTISRKTVWTVFALGCGALLLFFFFDLPIAQAVYRPGTWFGAFFRATAPTMPSVCGLIFFGCLARSESETRGRRFAGYLAAILLSALGGYLFFHYLGWSHPVAVAALAVALLVGALLLGGVLHPQPEALRRASLTAFLMILLVFLAVELLKAIWGRPRFYAMTDPAAEFTRWLFPQGRPISDAFKSFPSGHAANGSAVLLLLLLPSVFPGAARHQTALRIFVGAWIVLTAFSRLMEGMHFASDVTAGFLLAFGIFCGVSCSVFARKKNETPKERKP